MGFEQWKDLIKIYGLVFGAALIVGTIYFSVYGFMVDPVAGLIILGIGLVPMVVGGLIIYFIFHRDEYRMPYLGYGVPYPQQYQYYGTQYTVQGHQYPPQYQYQVHYQPPPQGYPPPQMYPPPQGYPPPQAFYQYPPQNHQFPPHGYPVYQPPSTQMYDNQRTYAPIQGYPGGANHTQPRSSAQRTSFMQGPSTTNSVDRLIIPRVIPLALTLILAIFIGVGALVMNLWIIFVPCFIIAFSFPSLIWMSYVYNRDINEPEPARMVLISLTWGMLSVIPSLLFEAPFNGEYFLFILPTFIAPLVEESFKPIVLPYLRDMIDNELDGLIYGVTAGMGFAMMENLMYESLALGNGTGWGLTALARGLGSTVGHAVGAGIIGFTFARYIKGRGSIFELAGSFGIAVGLHMTWNGILSITTGTGSMQMLAVMIIFIIVWPQIEFLILKYFLDKASDIDSAMFDTDGKKGHRQSGREGIIEPIPTDRRIIPTRTSVSQIASRVEVDVNRIRGEDIPRRPIRGDQRALGNPAPEDRSRKGLKLGAQKDPGITTFEYVEDDEII